MDDYMFFALGNGQFKQKFIQSYSILPIMVSVVPNFIPISAGGFAHSQSANGKSTNGNTIKDN